jgi:pyridoxal phosphate enzyme (YggS family)
MADAQDRIGGRIHALKARLPEGVTLVAVSKTRPLADLLAAYAAGQRDFGENKVQELLDKAPGLPEDVRLHHIGHLQTNKVKALLPAAHLIHGVDSERVLAEVNRRALERGTRTSVLLQVHIAQEEQKFGWEPDALRRWMDDGGAESHPGVLIRGLMGMATFTSDVPTIQAEFRGLRTLYDQLAPHAGWDTLSMGMSGDWEIAVAEGSTLIRVGSAIFGDRA